MKRIIRRSPRLAMSVKLAVAMLAPAKVGASVKIADNTMPSLDGNDSGVKTAVQEFVSDKQNEVNQTGRHALQAAASAWTHIVDAAVQKTAPGSSAQMMTDDEIRLFLQSYNAGPYACLKHKGNVPFRETRNYIPKVMKYYQQNLSDTPYDHLVVASANKYGLDPQLIRAIMKTESNFNRRTVSGAGARGLMQVMPVVWSEVMKRYDMGWNYNKEVFDPAKNIDVACAYLAWLRFDFLPRHFNEFDRNPTAPTYVVRDKIRSGSKPRISVASAEVANEVKTVASVVEPKRVDTSEPVIAKTQSASKEIASKETDSVQSVSKNAIETPKLKPNISISDSRQKSPAKITSDIASDKDVTITRNSNRKIIVKVSGKGSHDKSLAAAKRAIQ